MNRVPDPRYKRCRLCGRPSTLTGELSWQRLCEECGAERREANIDHLMNHRGEFFDHWRRKHAAAVGAVLVDDLVPPA